MLTHGKNEPKFLIIKSISAETCAMSVYKILQKCFTITQNHFRCYYCSTLTEMFVLATILCKHSLDSIR